LYTPARASTAVTETARRPHILDFELIVHPSTKAETKLPLCVVAEITWIVGRSETEEVTPAEGYEAM
jgi:hypothetical protein